MDHREEIEAARLLSGKDEPSVLEREQIFEGVLDTLGRGRRRSWAGLASATLASFAVAAAAMFMVQPGAMPVPGVMPGTPEHGVQAGEFGARGDVVGAALELLCNPGPECKRDDTLVFRVSHAPADKPYFAAFARGTDGAVVWYFPSDAAGLSLAFNAGEWLNEGVVLGAGQPAGTYTVHAFISAEPLTRDEVKAFVDEAGRTDVVALTAELTVHP